MFAAQCAVGKDEGLGQGHHVLKQRGMGGEALEESWNIGATKVSAEVMVERGHFACGRGLFNDRDVERRGAARDAGGVGDLFVLGQSHRGPLVKAFSGIE